MALIELNLEKPALKRTESRASTDESRASTSSKTKSKSADESSSKTIEMPEGEEREEESSGGGMLRRIAMLGAIAGTVFAVRRWRSRRSESTTSEYEKEWESARTE